MDNGDILDVNSGGQNPTFDKTTGIVAYMTLIGWIIALVQNGEKQGAEKSFNAFHIRQMLGLMIFSFGGSMAFMLVTFILVFLGGLGGILIMLLQFALFGSLLALWIMGVIAASNGEKKEVPVLGGLIQKMLGTAFE